jgi:hypothetical protein
MREPSSTKRFLGSLGYTFPDLAGLVESDKRFPDGAHYRLEVPSTETPHCLEVIFEEAARFGVPVHRVSQGSGAFMHTDDELDRFATLGAAAGVEISIFARPNSGWGTSAMPRSPDGAVSAGIVRGPAQLVHAMEDIRRTADHGLRRVLITDIGVLSVMLPVGNPAAARVIQDLGASTINIPTDLTLQEMAAIRAAIDIPIDVYVEAPIDVGGFIRYPELPDIIRVAAPVYVKVGISNAPDIYPAGRHLEATLEDLSRERVRRARLALDLLERAGSEAIMSDPGAAGLAVPVVATPQDQPRVVAAKAAAWTAGDDATATDRA